MSFSRRQGIEAAKALQVNSMDRELRHGLWNAFHVFVVDPIVTDYSSHRYVRESSFKVLFHALWLDFFKAPLSTMPEFTDRAIENVQAWFYHGDATWNRVYDFIEFVAGRLERPNKFRDYC